MEPGRASTAWPLVGRDVELQHIELARRDADCRGIVVSAAAGVGKSRLAREAHLAAERDGALVDWVQATSSAATVPLGAFAGLIPPAARSDNALELMRQSTDMLLERAHGRRIVLGVDDAQLLDPVSAALVLHLSSSASTFVIATVRSGEPCPDAIVSLWKDAGARRIELQRLSDEAVETPVPGQGTAPPIIDGLDGAAIALTSRETQLVELARRGLTNTEIADELVLSVRTVETHLYRAMRKLGVSDRHEL